MTDRINPSPGKGDTLLSSWFENGKQALYWRLHDGGYLWDYAEDGETVMLVPLHHNGGYLWDYAEDHPEISQNQIDDLSKTMGTL